MVTIIRAAAGEPGIPAGFPILLDRSMAVIEPVFAWLMEHATLRGRSHASETVRTYGEHLHDWFDTLDQSDLGWQTIDEGVIAAYRNRMLETPSPHTGRPYARSTINARVMSVCRFYQWAHDEGWVDRLPFRRGEHKILRTGEGGSGFQTVSVNLLSLSQPERLPRPLRVDELERQFAKLGPTARLAAEWALTAGLRRKEICGLTPGMIPDGHLLDPHEMPLVGIGITITKGSYPRTVYPPLRLIDHSNWYAGEERAWIISRCRRRDPAYHPPDSLLLTETGSPMSRGRLTALFAQGFADAGLTGTLHWLRHTFAMIMLAQLQRQAQGNPDLNPLKIVQVLMGHRSITTTAIYLRCVELHEQDVAQSLEWLYGAAIPDAA